MVVIPQRLGDPVPVAAVISSTMDEDQERLAGIAPVYVLELEALRVVVMGSRANNLWSSHAASFLVSNVCLNSNNTDSQWQIFFSLIDLFSCPRQTGHSQLVVKVVRISSPRIGEQGAASRTQVMPEKGDQLGKGWPVVEDLGTEDKGGPLVYDRLSEIEQCRLKERAVIQLRIDRSEGKRVRVFVGECDPTSFKGGNDTGQAKTTAEVEDL